MITREQVADLRAGDVVEMTDDRLCTARGPLHEGGHAGALMLGSLTMVRYADGGVPRPTWSLTVVSRAPRPLYVNHDRTEPVPGDVVRGECGAQVWIYRQTTVSGYPWCSLATLGHAPRTELPARLRLLIDGETGQVVP